MLSKIPDWLWAVLICAAIFGAGVWRGIDVASARYEAELAAVNTTHAEQERARAEAVATAEKNARERLAAETERGNKLAGELLSKTQQLDAERASVNRRIRDVSETARRDCAGLSREWVRVYNEALDLPGAGDRPGGHNATTSATHNATVPSRTARSGVQSAELATPEDVLAHVRDYGQYCRKLEAGYRGLVDFVERKP